MKVFHVALQGAATVLFFLLCLLWLPVTKAQPGEESTLSSSEKMSWVPASNSSALCNDFTQAGFFIHQNPSSNDWVVFLESGGLCYDTCLLYTSPSPRDATLSRMPSSA